MVDPKTLGCCEIARILKFVITKHNLVMTPIETLDWFIKVRKSPSDELAPNWIVEGLTGD